MKKFISTFLAVLMAFSSISFVTTAFAADSEATVFDLSTTFSDKANWIGNGHKVNATKDSVKMEYQKDGSIVSYTGRTFENEIIEFTMDMDLVSGGWPGISLRTTNPETVIWNDSNGYLFVFQGDYIEVQRWRGTQKFMVVTKKMPPLKNGKNSIQIGAINTDAGVNIIFNANGTQVVNILDTEALAVTDAGYLSFYLSNTVTLTKKGADAQPPAAINSKITVGDMVKVGDTVTASYDYVDFAAKAEKDSVIQWYRSDKQAGTEDDSELAQELRKLQAEGKFSGYEIPGAYEKIEGANSLSYTLTQQDEEKYLMFTVTPKNADGLAGYEVRSGVQFIDTLPSKMAGALCMLVDSEFAFVDNKKFQIDPDDMWVCPVIDESSNRTLVPLRFIAESFGAEVGWNPDTAEIDFKVGDYTIHMVLGEMSMTVNGAVVALDTPSQVLNDRTMLPLRAVAEAIGKKAFWDGDTQLIVISDTENLFDNAKDAKQIERLVDRILKEDF